MEYLLLIQLLLAIWAFVSALIALFNEIKRTQELKKVCKQMGWEFSRQGKTSQLNNLLHFHLFSIGSYRQIRNLFYNKTQEFNIAIFDYYFQLGNSIIANQTVIYFRSKLLNLPDFNLLRKPHLESKTFGNKEVVFPSRPVFSDRYTLWTDNEEAVRRKFSDCLVTYFEQKRNLSAEGAKDRLILYCLDERINRDRVQTFLEEGYRVFELFKEI